jgi:cytochrome c553
MRILIACMLALVTLAAAAADTVHAEFTAAVQARPDWMHGEALFNDTCIGCHGPTAGGQVDGSIPSIAAQHFRVIAKQLVDYRHDQRWDLRMQHFTDRHRLVDAQDIADVATYVSSLPPSRTSGVGDGDFVQHGQAAYAGLCASCHGSTAAGDNSHGVPRLAGQHYAYLLRQMHDAVEGRRPNFPADHRSLLARLERDDFVGISDYLSRLDAVTSPPPQGLADR